MSWAEETKSLTREIFKMHEETAKFVRRMQKDIKQMKREWNSTRAQMRNELLSHFNAYAKARADEVASIRAAAQALLQKINKRDKERIKEVEDLRGAVQAFLSRFRAEDFTAIINRHAERSKEVEDLKATAQALLQELNKRDKERAKEVEGLKAAVQDFLKKFRDEDIAGFKEGNRQRAKAIAQFKLEVGTLLGGFKKDHEEAGAAWKDLLGKMVAPEAEKKEVKRRVKPAKKEVVEEEVEEERELRELSGKEVRILSIVNDHPKGVTLPEIAYLMGVAFVTISKDVKKLLSEGIIIRKGNKYCPAR